MKTSSFTVILTFVVLMVIGVAVVPLLTGEIIASAQYPDIIVTLLVIRNKVEHLSYLPA